MVIKLRTELVRKDANLDDECFLTYTALMMQMKKDKQEYSITVDGIVGELYQRWECPRRYRQYIPMHIQKLADAGYIKIINTKTLQRSNESAGTAFILDLSGLEIPDGKKFISITEDDVHSLLNIPDTRNNISLFRYYCVLISTIDYNKKYGKYKLSDILNYMTDDICPKTQYNYNKILQEYEFIYFHKFNTDRVFPDGGIKSFSHIYGLYENMTMIETEARKLQEKYKKDDHYTLITRSSKRNLAKSIKQKINAMKKGYIYSLEDLYQMKQDAEEINNNYQDIISHSDDHNVADKYEKQMIDVSVINSQILYVSNSTKANKEVG